MKSASLLCIAVFLGLVMAALDWAARLGLGAAHSGKVIIEKSRGEVSLIGQDTIENVS